MANTIDSFSLTDCGLGAAGCPAATYSFNISTTQAILTVTIDGAVSSTNDRIEGVDLGFLASGDISGLRLGSVSGPSNTLGLWTTVDTGSLSNNGCGGNSGAFICASSATPTPDGVLIATGDTYSWTWTYNPISLSAVDAAGNVHVGVNYDPHYGFIVSETANQVATPEPISIVLLTTGLLALALFMRRPRPVASEP